MLSTASATSEALNYVHPSPYFRRSKEIKLWVKIRSLQPFNSLSTSTHSTKSCWAQNFFQYPASLQITLELEGNQRSNQTHLTPLLKQQIMFKRQNQTVYPQCPWGYRVTNPEPATVPLSRSSSCLVGHVFKTCSLKGWSEAWGRRAAIVRLECSQHPTTATTLQIGEDLRRNGIRIPTIGGTHLLPSKSTLHQYPGSLRKHYGSYKVYKSLIMST